MKSFIKFLVLMLLLAGCKTYQTKYPYSLADFDPELRTQLEKILQNGGLCDFDPNADRSPGYYTYLTEKTAAKDLYRLIDCEHPVLRAYAFRCLVDREDTAINHILLNHLDDTAIITRCMGEFGEDYTYVSDYFISASNHNTKILKEELVNRVITNHTYLSYAYFFIKELETPEEKYYNLVKQMAENPGRFHPAERKTIAIRALSKYKKKEDISFIAKELSFNWAISDYQRDSCFSIIAQNPDTAYFNILKRFYKLIAGPQNIFEIQNNFATGYYELGEKYDSFLEALAAFKNKRSSEIVDTIIQRELYPLNSYKDYRYEIYTLLKKNECPEYRKLIGLLQPEATAYERRLASRMSSWQTDLPPMPSTLDSSYSDKHDPRYW